MPTALASQWVEVTMPKVPSSSGRVVNTCGLLGAVRREVRRDGVVRRGGRSGGSRSAVASERRPVSASTRWQATRWSGEVTPASGGTSTRQRSTATGQRVWKWQPGGGSSGLGRSPRSTTRVRARWAAGSGTGAAVSSDCV